MWQNVTWESCQANEWGRRQNADVQDLKIVQLIFEADKSDEKLSVLDNTDVTEDTTNSSTKFRCKSYMIQYQNPGRSFLA